MIDSLSKKMLLQFLNRINTFAAQFHAGICIIARMAELVDALDSKSGFRKKVQVRFLFRAH